MNAKSNRKLCLARFLIMVLLCNPLTISAAEKTVVFKGSKEILFDITFWINDVLILKTTHKDAFSKKETVQRITAQCTGSLQIKYLGSEDFVFDNWVVGPKFNVNFKDIGLMGDTAYVWGPETDVIYSPGEIIRIMHDEWPFPVIETPSEKQIKEVYRDRKLKCDPANIESITPEKDTGKKKDNPLVKFRSGKTMTGDQFMDHSEVSLLLRPVIFSEL